MYLPRKLDIKVFLLVSVLSAGLLILAKASYPPLKNWKAIAVLVAVVFTLLAEEQKKTILNAVPLGFIGAPVIQIVVDLVAVKKNMEWALLKDPLILCCLSVRPFV